MGRKTLALITLSLGLAIWIILNGLKQPSRNGDKTLTRALVAQGNLAELSTVSLSATLFLSQLVPRE
jgi:hypothetical protein